MNIQQVSVKELHTRLGFSEKLDYPKTSLEKSLIQWKMEIDDAPILRYIYRNFQPHRHLEYGTWQGEGVLYCLQESKATVWTINLLEGELKPDGTLAYGEPFEKSSKLPSWVKKMGGTQDNATYQTDSLGFIGRYYLEAGLGYRVCQIYADSLKWDISNYPKNFFDSVLIDGGHTEQIIENDTNKALQLTRPGALIMWHDYCPVPEVNELCTSTRGSKAMIENNWKRISSEMKDMFWIKPSWILVGIKK